MKAKVLLSGGVDSATCLNFFLMKKFDVSSIFIDYGQPGALFEKKSAQAISKYFGVNLKILSMEKKPTIKGTGEIAGRNAFLIFSALLYSEDLDGFLVMGIHSGTEYYDCSKGFIKKIGNIISSYTNGNTKLSVPFKDWSKREVFDYAIRHNIPFHLTRSCERKDETPCGKCLSCRDRQLLNV